MNSTEQVNKPKSRWFKRAGVAGILFFTIKGCITGGIMLFALWKSCN